MRILFLVDAYLPSPVSSAKLIGDLAREMVALGHEALVVAPTELPDAGPGLDESRAGVTVLRVDAGGVKSPSRVRRLIAESRISSRYWRAGRSLFGDRRCDLIVSYSPSMFFGPLVARLRRLWNCPSYLVLRDVCPQWWVDTGRLRAGSPLHRYFQYFERRMYAAADVIGAQSPANRDHLLAAGVPAGKLEVLYNWFALDSPVPRTDFRRRLGLEGKVVLFFGGNLGSGQDPDALVELARRLADEPQAHVLLVGGGTEHGRIARRVAELGLTNMTVHGALDQQSYLGALDEFDIGLIALHPDLRTTNYPGKMFSYFYLAKPILARVNPGTDLETLLHEHDAGLVVADAALDGFVDAARRLVRDAALRERLGGNGRRLLETMFSARTAACQIVDAIESLARGRHP